MQATIKFSFVPDSEGLGLNRTLVLSEITPSEDAALSITDIKAIRMEEWGEVKYLIPLYWTKLL